MFLEPRAAAGRGRLTERLLAQGLLTPTMLEELQNEWNRNEETQTPSTHKRDDHSTNLKKVPRRKRKP